MSCGCDKEVWNVWTDAEDHSEVIEYREVREGHGVDGSPSVPSPAVSLSDPEPFDYYEAQRDRADREYLNRLEETRLPSHS